MEINRDDLEYIELLNRYDLEYIELINSGFEGWVMLSSGKVVYISQPRSSAKETGIAMKNILNRMNEDSLIK